MYELVYVSIRGQTTRHITYVHFTGAKERMWAPDGIKWKGKYYLVYCANDATGEFKTGLAVADVPQGPFVDIGYIYGALWYV